MIAASPTVKDELCEEQLRHTCYYVVNDEPAHTTSWGNNSGSDSYYSTLICAEEMRKQRMTESETEHLLRQAQEYRRRNLSYLYRPKLVPRLLFILRVPPIVFQPCWSSRRWKSLT